MDDLRKLIDEKLKENSGHREALLSLIASGEAVGFVGAGMSSPLKFPDWTSLISKLTDEAQKLGSFDPTSTIKLDVLEYAKAIKDHFTRFHGINLYRNIIGREFGPRDSGENCTETHGRLVKLPFRAFITTNYDACVEQALQNLAAYELRKSRPDPGYIIKASKADGHLVSRFLRSISHPPNVHRCSVAHLHGRWDDTQNIILTSDDYAAAYASGNIHRNLAWALFATRRMVFVGCSMDDPYIKRLLDSVAIELWEAGQEIHFAILPINGTNVSSLESQEAAFLRYGLQVVYFDNLSGNFTGLDLLLDDALERCPKINSAGSTPIANIPKSTPEKPLLETTPKVPIDAEWLKNLTAEFKTGIKKNEN